MRQTIFVQTVALFLLAAGESSVIAQQAEKPVAKIPSREQQPGHQGRLAETDFSTRQQATFEMWRQRELSRDEVQAASRDSDPEVSSRAQWILRQWRRGALPDTPSDLNRLLGRTDDPSAIDELLDAYQFGAAVVAVEESAGMANSEAIRNRATMMLQRKFGVYAVQASRSGSLPDLLKLVDLVADGKELAQTRVELMRHVGLDVDESSLLPASAESWAKAMKVQTEVVLHACQGNLQEALRIAATSNDDSLVKVLRMLDGRWSDIATSSAELARQSPATSVEHVRHWCDALLGADRAGLEDVRREAIESLTAAEANSSALGVALRWKSLAVHGEMDAALEILRQQSPMSAALVAIASARQESAFEWLGYSNEAIESNWVERINEVLLTQKKGDGDPVSEELQNLFVVMRGLLSIGRNDLAWLIADTLSRTDLELQSVSLRELVVFNLALARQSDWVLRLAVQPSDDSLSATMQETLAKNFDDFSTTDFRDTIEAITRTHPENSLVENVQVACQLFSGQTPEGWGPDNFRAVFDHLLKGRRHVQRVRGRVVLASNPMLSLALVNMFAVLGQPDLARLGIEHLIANGDIEAQFHYAEKQMATGRSDVAKQYFNAIWNGATLPRDQSSARGALSEEWAIKSLIGLWLLAKREGDLETDRKLQEEIRLALYTPSTELRHTAAKYFTQHAEKAFASEIYATLLPLTAFGSDEATEFYDVANHYSFMVRDDDVGAAAKWFDLAVSSTLEAVNFREVAYVTLPLFVSRWRLEASIQAKDEEGVARELHRIDALNPVDIDTAERLMPRMAEAGLNRLADPWFDRMLNRGADRLEKYPMQAVLANNLAWVAAINDHDLDRALQWSTWATYLEPDSTVYRDTLAEVLFRLGRTEEALLVERGCILDDPGQWHLHEQVDRFEKKMP